jgi:hypothetical protein
VGEREGERGDVRALYSLISWTVRQRTVFSDGCLPADGPIWLLLLLFCHVCERSTLFNVHTYVHNNNKCVLRTLWACMWLSWKTDLSVFSRRFCETKLG